MAWPVPVSTGGVGYVHLTLPFASVPRGFTIPAASLPGGTMARALQVAPATVCA